MTLLYTIDIVVFAAFFINILYLFIFSVAGRYGRKRVPYAKIIGDHKLRRFAILIPAYKEDVVIRECVDSCLAQHYPNDQFDVVVISDRMSETTNSELSELNIKLIRVFFENSTKSKALNFAMNEIGNDYDIALVLDADNTIASDFLTRMNDAFTESGLQIIQAHRCAKNTNTSLALLDAVSEEINNNIFRQGHVNLGLSSALIGSGMAFDYALFKQTMASITAVGGFDRALELALLSERKQIGYLADVYVEDEKVQHQEDFSRQRRRWLSAQWHYFSITLYKLPGALRKRNWDYCDKMFQQMSIPRLLLLGFSALIAMLLLFIEPQWALKWFILLGILLITFALSIPRNLISKKLWLAMINLPQSFLIMASNLFRIKGANKKFIHTSHGVKYKKR